MDVSYLILSIFNQANLAQNEEPGLEMLLKAKGKREMFLRVPDCDLSKAVFLFFPLSLLLLTNINFNFLKFYPHLFSSVIAFYCAFFKSLLLLHFLLFFLIFCHEFSPLFTSFQMLRRPNLIILAYTIVPLGSSLYSLPVSVNKGKIQSLGYIG